jgi:arylsulfatase
MAIDLLPTLAEITGSKLPDKIIDGKSVWNVFTGESLKSPQKAYFFYYKVNELHGVRYGKWKMYFPHNYRSMTGQEPGLDGVPGDYRYIDMDAIELYDLSNDEGETNNVADKNPEVVLEIKLLANDIRYRLGDSLLGIEGVETRAAGKVE